ncbi:9-O-acetylesterase [Caulobacter flavus]|uniref:9-O-acetylesterase n=1 Tax=Caulobacter flavus TaxID=1679497 RepID=A0A2N5CUN6_9CAUL|nr:sialate O-acetylesterase [Caulobacter flavus]AYV44974.1 9-O-acetylesterase [Caulobacter flavus]PLR17242.1 9-O-acetylesterase [Caulobacter flavus]
MRRVAPILLAAVMATPAAAQAPLLNGLFADHAVVQRGRPLPVFGAARPGEAVTVSFGGKTATATTGADGAWRVDLPAMAAGGPYILEAKAASGAVQTVGDVLVGDVWLCSGQSNMELPVERGNNSWSEIRSANDDGLRMAYVDHADSREPRKTFLKPPAWKAAKPDAVGSFSAACYYMARELRKTDKTPLGLVHASWGGSAIEAWLSPAALRKAGDYDNDIATLELSVRDRPAAERRWGETIKAWWSLRHNGAASGPWNGLGDWTPAPQGLGVWEAWGAPALADFNGMVWFETSITLTAAQAKGAASLEIGMVDEVDTTFVNGVGVGSTSGAGTVRVYPVAAGTLKAGANRIVVSALDTYANGGMYGETARALVLADGTRIPLTAWRYQVEPKTTGEPPRAPWDTLSGVSTLYNGMLAPMGPYAFKGFAWYQGESNTGRAQTYQALLHELVGERRVGQAPDMPALVVQLANYGKPQLAPEDSGWPQVREAQRLAVARDGRAALAVTADIGDPSDIHPTNKQDVGKRLARGARRLAGEAVTTGPSPVSARRVGEVIEVRFEQVAERLATRGSDRAIGFELCDAAGCRFADARVEGDRASIAVPAGMTPAKVRFAWADAPTFNVFDMAGLPLGPFEIAVAP